MNATPLRPSAATGFATPAARVAVAARAPDRDHGGVLAATVIGIGVGLQGAQVSPSPRRSRRRADRATPTTAAAGPGYGADPPLEDGRGRRAAPPPAGAAGAVREVAKRAPGEYCC